MFACGLVLLVLVQASLAGCCGGRAAMTKAKGGMSDLATACARAWDCSRLTATGAAALDNNDNTAPRHVSKLSLQRSSCKRRRVVLEWKRGCKWQVSERRKAASQPKRCLTSFAGQSVQ